MPSAAATDKKPSDDITLFDGTTTVGLVLVDQRGQLNPRSLQRRAQNRQALKASEGEGTYGDFQPPYIPVVQSDWSGGRGQEDFERDRSRFFDSYRLNTWKANQVTLGPQEQYTTGYRVDDYVMPGSLKWTSLLTSTRYIAVKFSAEGGTMDKVYLWVRVVGAPGDIKVELNDDSPGDPSTARETVTVTAATFGTDQASQLYVFDWSGTNTTIASTNYGIKIYAASADSSTNHWEVDTTSTVGNAAVSSDNSAWAAGSVGLYFRLVDVDDDGGRIFFEYKQGWYMVNQPIDNTASQLWINGDRGTADDNSGDLTNIEDSSKSWTTNEFTDSIAIITEGPGSEEIIPWRLITGNDGNSINCTPDWVVTHTTATEYVIVADDTFIENTTTGLTVPVTDVLVSKDNVYFAQGVDVDIRRLDAAASVATGRRPMQTMVQTVARSLSW